MKPLHLEAEYYSTSLTELTESIQSLLDAAIAACSKAYAPYSDFQVGCSILLDSGHVVIGSNVENAAYSTCICAERNALTSVATLYPQSKILSMAIAHTNKSKDMNRWISPCGECRQMMSEFVHRQGQSFDIYLYGSPEEIIWVPKVKDLLPLVFTPDHLDVK